MTEKQRKILLFIADFINTHGYPPSYQEICYALKIKSKSQVFEFVKRLKEQGHIKTVNGRKRSMSIVHQDEINIILKEKHDAFIDGNIEILKIMEIALKKKKTFSLEDMLKAISNIRQRFEDMKAKRLKK